MKSGSKPAVLDKKDEVVANVIWRFLELRGCVCVSFDLYRRLSMANFPFICLNCLVRGMHLAVVGGNGACGV
jgi:hypothetical protein